MKRLWLELGALTVFLSLGSCGPCRNSGDRILRDSQDWEALGTPLDGGPAAMGVSLDILVFDPDAFEGQRVLTRDAVVESVDPIRGEWLIVKCDAGRVRVSIEGDAFAFPQEAAGRDAMIEGVFTAKPTAGGEPLLVATGLRLSN